MREDYLAKLSRAARWQQKEQKRRHAPGQRLVSFLPAPAPEPDQGQRRARQEKHPEKRNE